MEKHSVSFLQDIKNCVSNSYFVKIKTTRLQASKLLGNRRGTYVWDATCNRFYFGEVQEEILDQCSRQGKLAPRTENLSIKGLFQKNPKKQAGWLRKCLRKYSNEVSGFVWKFWKNRRSLQVWIHKAYNTHWRYQGQKRLPLNQVAFLLIIHKLSSSPQKIPHAVSSTRSQFHIFKPIDWVFYWNSLIQKDVWAMASSEWDLYVAAKLLTYFKRLKGVSTFLLILGKKQLSMTFQRKQEQL